MRYASGVLPSSLDDGLVEALERAELASGLEFVITSGYREGDSRCHGSGKAVDIACDSSQHRFGVVRGLLTAGFERVGLYSAHVHADICQMDHASRVIWLGGASK